MFSIDAHIKLSNTLFCFAQVSICHGISDVLQNADAAFAFALAFVCVFVVSVAFSFVVVCVVFDVAS